MIFESLRFSRPRGPISFVEIEARQPGSWVKAFSAETLDRVAPISHGASPVVFPTLASSLPDLGVACLPEGYLYGAQGWAFTAAREYLPEATWYGADANGLQLPRSLARPRRVSGACLSLCSDFAAGNYGHYILDGLTRLAIFRRAGGRLDDIAHVILPRPPSKSADRVLDLLEIPPAKRLWAVDAQWLQADRLLVTSFPGLKRNYPRWLPSALRRHVQTPAVATSTRLYVPRTGVRRAVNEPQLIEIAREFGFQIHDFERCQDEPQLFGTAEAVIGAHGAALANLAFCNPGTRVLELVPSDHVFPYYYTVAESMQLEYHALMGRSFGSRPAGSFGPSPFDFAVDPEEFRAALMAMRL